MTFNKNIIFVLLIAASIFFNIVPALAVETVDRCTYYGGTWDDTDTICNFDDPEKKAVYEAAFQAWLAEYEDVNPTILHLCESYGGTWDTISNDCVIYDPEKKAAYEIAYDVAYQEWKAEIEKSNQEVIGGYCVFAGCD